MKQPKILLGLIVFLALTLRLVFLGTVPAGFTPDEASQAYSAYSLLKTGHDEWGVLLPLSSFKSFLDYKAPLQTYLMIPSIALFGLNEFAARLPSALFGTLAVLAIYLLTNELFGLRPLKSSWGLNLGHLAAFLLAISPWHLQFSRTALEVNLASFLFPLGLYFFLRGLEEVRHLGSTQNFIWTAISWGFCLYTYHAAKVFLPLFVLVLLLQNLSLLSKVRQSLIFPLAAGFLLTIPLMIGTFWGQAGKRGSDLLITSLSDEQIISINHESFYSPLNRLHRRLPRIFHNPIVYSLSKFVENYISYYTPSFWFTEGGREITYSIIPGRGLLYFWLMPLVAWGLLDLLRDPKNKKYLRIILPWLLLAAIPAALTKDGYRPNRAGSFALVWEMLAAYGLYSLAQMKFRYKKIITLSFLGAAFLITLYYFEDYYFGSSVNYPTALSYGWRETINYVQNVQEDYKQILVQQGNQPQSFIAFYTKLDPRFFQQASTVWEQQITQDGHINYLDQLGQYQLGKYNFETLNWPEDINSDTLYVSMPSALLPAQRRILHKVEIPDGVAFEIFDFRK